MTSADLSAHRRRLADDIRRATEQRERVAPVLRAMERRWPVRRAPVGVARSGSCTVALDAIFEVVAVLDGDRVSVRLLGWDRDLSDRVPDHAEVAVNRVAELMDRVASTIEDLRPSVDPGAPRHEPPRAATTSELSTPDALAARRARQRGEDPQAPLIDADRLTQLVRERWPDAAITERTFGENLREISLRPYGSSRIVVGAEPHGGLSAGAYVGTAVDGAMLGRSLLARRDEGHVRDLTAALDDWLIATMPPPWVLQRPVVTAP